MDFLFTILFTLFCSADDYAVKANAHRAAYIQQQQHSTLPRLKSGELVDFYSLGVIVENGVRYTYYSSKVLHHYRTEEWTAGNDHIYRTKDGYIVVASGAHKIGAIVDTPFGKGMVLDFCETEGTIDIYVNI